MIGKCHGEWRVESVLIVQFRQNRTASCSSHLLCLHAFVHVCKCFFFVRVPDVEHVSVHLYPCPSHPLHRHTISALLAASNLSLSLEWRISNNDRSTPASPSEALKRYKYFSQLEQTIKSMTLCWLLDGPPECHLPNPWKCISSPKFHPQSS